MVILRQRRTVGKSAASMSTKAYLHSHRQEFLKCTVLILSHGDFPPPKSAGVWDIWAFPVVPHFVRNHCKEVQNISRFLCHNSSAVAAPGPPCPTCHPVPIWEMLCSKTLPPTMNPAVRRPDNPHGQILATVCDRQDTRENFIWWCLSGLKFLRNFWKLICGLVMYTGTKLWVVKWAQPESSILFVPQMALYA